MKYYFLIFIFQVLFNVFKVLEIKYTFEDKLTPLLFNSIWINLVSLASVYFSIDRLFEGDWVVIFFYIAGSIIGKWIALRKMENIRSKIFQFIFRK
jgi:uncharacterized membrane protein YqgA involved in biofilm formation